MITLPLQVDLGHLCVWVVKSTDSQPVFESQPGRKFSNQTFPFLDMHVCKRICLEVKRKRYEGTIFDFLAKSPLGISLFYIFFGGGLTRVEPRTLPVWGVSVSWRGRGAGGLLFLFQRFLVADRAESVRSRVTIETASASAQRLHGIWFPLHSSLRKSFFREVFKKSSGLKSSSLRKSFFREVFRNSSELKSSSV